MRTYIENFKKYSYLLSELVMKDIKLKYRRSKLGILWTLIEPILTTLVLALVFESFRKRGNKEYSFVIYILTGRLLYSFFSGATRAATKSIRTNGSMIKKVYVPKYIYPIASILANYVIFIISMIVLVGAVIVCRVPLTWHVLEGIFPLVIILIMALGVGMILSTISVFFRDIEYLWGVILTLVMYCSAIFYEMPENIEWICKWNPLYAVIMNFRNAILFGKAPDIQELIYSIVVSLVSVVVGFYVFFKKQDEFILHI